MNARHYLSWPCWKGCLDECDICEPALKQQMALDLVRMDLQNQLLKKQIELLEKSQQYRHAIALPQVSQCVIQPRRDLFPSRLAGGRSR